MTEIEKAQAQLKELRGQTRHARRLVEWSFINQSFPYFLFAYVRTRDEHDATKYAKEIPAKEYIGIAAQAMQVTRRLAVPKSRQLLVTWMVAAFVLWVALTRDHALCFVQSKKEEDADAVLGRIFDIYVRLPEWIQKENPINPGKGGERQYCHMHFPWTRRRIELVARAKGLEPEYLLEKTERAHIWGIPQGGEILRSYTSTLIFSDEDAFQEEAGSAYTACVPTLADDSWFIKVSSANPGHFESVVFDQLLDQHSV